MGNARARARVLCLLSAFGLPLSATAQTDPLTEPLGPTFDWRDLLPVRGGDGSLGYVLRNCQDEWQIAASLGLRHAGDINGDGLDDLLYDVGSVYSGVPVAWGILMSLPDAPAVLDVSATSTLDGFQLPESFPSASGIAGVGDINGDGFDDVVGVEERFNCGRGCYYYGQTTIVFGRDESTAGPYPSILPGAPAVISGGRLRHVTAASVRADLNSDGINDLLVSFPEDRASWRSSLAVVFGRPVEKPFPSYESVNDLIDDTGGMYIGSDWLDARFTGRGGSIGDLNRDGVSDVAVGVRGTDTPTGVYVIFGRRLDDPFPRDFDPTAADTSEVVLFEIEEPGWDITGVGTAGDLNGDGIDDMAVSAFASDRQRRLYIVFGRHDSHRDPFPPVFSLEELDGANGFVLHGADGWSIGGTHARPLGDVNGDEVDDLLLADCIFYGQKLFHYPAVVRPDEVPHGQLVRFEGSDDVQLAPLGDVNGDGVTDIGASFSGGDCEVAAIIYGRRPPPPCRADMDRDGEITIFDWLTFSTAWEAHEPLADVDGDGEYSLLDYLVYQAMFHYGCP